MSTCSSDIMDMANTTQEPKFINSDSDEEAPVEKQHKVAAADGNKPTVIKEDPAFDAVYRHATNELKRQICFINAFPTPTESDNLPPAVYHHGVHSVSKSGLYRHEDLRKLRSGFNKQWFKCVRPYTSTLYPITNSL